MSIEIDTELILVGIFTKSQKPINQKILWSIRTNFYKLNNAFVIDISKSTVNSICLSRKDLFYKNSSNLIYPKKEMESQFKDGSLFNIYLKVYNKSIQNLIKEGFNKCFK